MLLHTSSVTRNQHVNSPSTNTRSTCEGVTRVHNALVNLDGKTQADVTFSSTAMAVVPVKVWYKGRETPVVTYAFLDSGSSSKFCTEALMRQLGANGTKTTISNYIGKEGQSCG